jgi:hypothetical protein
MFYIPIQKDFSKVKNKIVFGLTKRQIIFFLLGAAVGIPTYILLKKVVSVDIAGVAMITVMLPFFAFALYEKDGEYLEETIKHIIKERYLNPQVRPVVTDPLIYGCMQVSDYIEEQERLSEEAKEKSLAARIRKLRGGRDEHKHK